MASGKDPSPQLKDYVVTEVIGVGSYGSVYKARKKTGARDVVAVKCILKIGLSKFEVDNIITEISLLKKLKHEFIVEMIDFSWDSNYIYIIMEYCGGGDLSRFIRSRSKLPEETCKMFLQQLASALEYMRGHNVSHFDLKPQNILLTTGSGRFKGPLLKLADFGFALHLDKDQTKSAIRGSPLYMAPEMILQRQYDAKVDLWSVGVILFECLFGRAPYKSKSVDELLLKIKEDKEIEVPENISGSCRDLLTRLLRRNPAERIGFDDFFKHPFLDLEHMPSDESEARGQRLLDQGEFFEQRERFEEAFASYKNALEYLVPLLRCERNSAKKESIRSKINIYIPKAESLKCRIKGEPVPEVASVQPMSAKQVPSESSDEELMRLCLMTPQMKTGLEIIQSAELYELEGQYAVAIEKYETALSILIPLLKSEPKGHRKTLLSTSLKRWMGKAEAIKELMIIQEKVMNDHLPHGTDGASSFDKHCVVQ